MSTVRIQVRRGTSTDWSTVNPTLAAGEIGFESNTKKVKIGDGTTAWNSLDYISSDVPVIDEIAQDAVNSALTMGSGLSKTYNDSANTITLNNTGVLSFNTRTGSITLLDSDINTALGYIAADSATLTTLSADLTTLGNTTSQDITDAITTAETYTDTRFSNIQGNQNISILDNGTSLTVATENDLTISGELSSSSILTDNINANDTISTVHLTVSGDLTVNGTTTTVNSTDLNVADPIIYIGQSNSSNVLDLGIVGAFDDGTYQHTGLIRDASDGKWKLFSGVTTEPGTTVDFSTYTKDDLVVGGINATRIAINETVTENEILYLDGVTSNIQNQIDDKLSSSTAQSTYVAIQNGTINAPTFTGIITFPNGSIYTDAIQQYAVTTDKIDNLAVTSAKIAANSISNDKIATNAHINQSKIENLVSDFINEYLSILTLNRRLPQWLRHLTSHQ